MMDYSLIQEMEFESLQSIFGEDFKRVLIKTVWNVQKSKACSLITRPSKQDLRNFVQLTLLIELTPRYPDTEPIISIKNEKCILNSDCQVLLKELQRLARNCVGMEMIFDLHEHSSEFLNTHYNLAEMISNGYQGKSQLDDFSSRELIEKQRNLKQQEIEKRERQASFDQSIKLDLENKSTLAKNRNFNSNEFKLRCDGSDTKSFFYSAPIVTSMKALPGNLITVKIFPWKQYLFHAKDDVNDYIMIKIDQLINYSIVDNTFELPPEVIQLQRTLDKLSHSHTRLNIIKYQLILYPVDDLLNVTVKVLYLKNKSVIYTSLSEILQVTTFQFESLKPIFTSLVEQFKFIHSRGFYYKNQDSSFIIFQGKDPILLFPFYVRDVFSNINTIHNEESCPPELTSNPLAQPSSSSDVWCFAVILYGLLSGFDDFKLKKLKKLNVPNVFIDVLTSCTSIDPRDRPSFNELQKMESALFDGKTFNSIYNSRDLSNDAYLEQLGISPNTPSTFVPHSSRYIKDFEEIALIGSGGFGTVHKVLNKLDGKYYAIKKIKLYKNHSSYKQITREIRSLSQIDSPRCVRYFHSWLEQYQSTSASRQNSSSESELDSESDSLYLRKSYSDVEIEFDYADLQPALISPQVSFLKKSGEILESSNDDDHDFQQKEVLYIQMEFCDNLSLRDSIDKNIRSTEQAWKYFQQICEALQHIHSINIIHRDLNPKNVFIDKYDNIKLGDFGLSIFVTAQVEISKQNSTTLNSPLRHHSKSKSVTTDAVGTRLYIDPNQLTNRKTAFTVKVDIYSLGIILFELFYKFTTSMQRVHVLEDLRLPEIKFPNDFDMKLRTQYNLINSLLCHDPEKRPTSTDLLTSGIFPDSLQAINTSKATEIVLSNQTGIRQVTSELLKRTVKVFKDATYDVDANIQDLVSQSGHTHKVQQLLQRLFIARGAIMYNPPLLMPYTQNVVETMRSTDSAFLIDPLGASVVLPWDQSVNLSRILSKIHFPFSKIYIQNDIYRSSAALNQPRQIPQSLYAVVGNVDDDEFNKFAVLESVMLCNDLMDNLGIKNWYLCLNHCLILNDLLQLIASNDSDRQMLFKVLHLLPSHRFSTRDLQIPSVVDHNLLDKYNQRLPFEDLDLPCSINKYSKITNVDKLIIQLIGQDHVVWNPILAPTHLEANGIYFQLCIENQDKVHVGAVGEQQFDLNKMNESKQTSYTVRFGIPLLMRYSQDIKENSIVMICSYDPGLIKEKHEIAKMLRHNDISCDVWTGPIDHFDNNSSYSNLSHLLIMKNSKIVKLRDLQSKSEREIQQSQILIELNTILNKNTNIKMAANIVNFERKIYKRPVQQILDRLKDYSDTIHSAPVYVVEVTYKQLYQALIINDLVISEEIKGTIKSIQRQVKIYNQILIFTIDNQQMLYPQ
eukprot:NODE_214_length_14327_cov_0.392325.p1 type:complete len:1407 gc:universal NODE_214_length_14327_cov_0.392325:9716-5496(-)